MNFFKKSVFFFLILILLQILPAESSCLDKISDDISGKLTELLQNRFQVRTGIVAFENHTELNDLAVQKFYQMLVSRLEGSSMNAEFSDLMVDFSNGKGTFNLNRIENLNYLIYLKLIRHNGKIGAGATVFSLAGHRILGVVYGECLMPRGELKIINTPVAGMENAGFSRIVKLEVNGNLLDIRNAAPEKGETEYLFYYPDRIEHFLVKDVKLEKTGVTELNWDRPVFPVQLAEGRMLVFKHNGVAYVTLGANFSETAQVLVRSAGKWQKLSRIDFTPMGKININSRTYLAGATYEAGKNFFRNELVMLPLKGTLETSSEEYRKNLTASFGMAFSGSNDKLGALHLIDLNYQLQMYTEGFANPVAESSSRGAALDVLADRWLAVSDATRGKDKLYFYRTEKGARRLVYQSPVAGEIRFISAGIWKKNPGFWVLVDYQDRKKKAGLEFWKENDYKRRTQNNEGEISEN